MRIGDLTIYKDGKLTTIAKEVYRVEILDESGTTYAYTDDGPSARELALVKDGAFTTIFDVPAIVTRGPAFLDSSQPLYLDDGDLMLWDGKESRRIARDVENFWTSANAAHTSYSPYY